MRNNPYMDCVTGGMVYGLDGAMLFRPNSTCALFDAKGKLAREWKGTSVRLEPELSKTMSFGDMDVAHLARFVESIRRKDVRTASPVDEAVKSVALTHFANMAQLGGGDVIADPATGRLVSASREAARYWNREYAPGWEMN